MLKKTFDAVFGGAVDERAHRDVDVRRCDCCRNTRLIVGAEPWCTISLVRQASHVEPQLVIVWG